MQAMPVQLRAADLKVYVWKHRRYLIKHTSTIRGPFSSSADGVSGICRVAQTRAPRDIWGAELLTSRCNAVDLGPFRQAQLHRLTISCVTLFTRCSVLTSAEACFHVKLHKRSSQRCTSHPVASLVLHTDKAARLVMGCLRLTVES